MKYIKKFEHTLENKPYYSVELFAPFINWFYDNFHTQMEDEGWFISYSSAMNITDKYNVSYSNKVGDFWQVQKDDTSDLIDDMEAEQYAKKYGLLIDDYGVVIGYNNVSFLEHPDNAELYKNLNKYNL